VIGGRVKTTNLPWVIEETALAQALKLNPNSVHLINDLEAIAWAVPILRPIDVQTINPGEIVRNSAIGVIAPGTGLGESSVTIIQHALDSGSPSKLCAATIDLFVSILASEAANLAVKVLATRGVYRPVELVCTCWPLSRNPPLCSPSNVKGDLLN
jgi:glucokinase